MAQSRPPRFAWSRMLRQGVKCAKCVALLVALAAATARMLVAAEAARDESTTVDATSAKTASATPLTLYRGKYPGWPWICRTPGGKLVCVWREGDRHNFSSTGKMMLTESDDQGVTWTTPRTFYDEPGIDDRNNAILALSDNEWLVNFNTFTSEGVSRTMTLRTRNAGKSWEGPYLVCDQDARTRAAVVRLSTGELVMPFYRGGGEIALAGISTDGGSRWDVVEVPNAPGYMGDEWDLCELADGRLIGILRNNAPQGGGWFYKTQSTDRGRTWSTPVKTNLRDRRATSPAQIFLHEGRPVVLYSDARMVSVVMAISDDPNFVEWQVDQRHPCYRYRADGQPIVDGSYPVSVPVGPSKRFVVDYFHNGDDHLITGRFVDLPAAWSERR